VSRTAQRLRRILELVPWVVAQNEPPSVQETCRRFGTTPAQLAEDLETLFLCGLHPFTPDTMIEAWIDDDRVVIRSDLFTVTPRLDPSEALALVAAARAVVQTPGAPDALARGLHKLENALPGDLARSLVIDLDAPDNLADLRAAVADERRLEIEYFSYSRDALTTRRVDPAEVFGANGLWYLGAWCHLAQAPRCFRVDRIRRLTVLDRRAERAAEARGLDPSYSASEDDLRVTIDLSPQAAWLREYYPLESDKPRRGGGRRVVLATASPEWLTRLLVRLGPHAKVVKPLEVREAVRAAADRILARYQ
jgi:proteasome accessory factor C